MSLLVVQLVVLILLIVVFVSYGDGVGVVVTVVILGDGGCWVGYGEVVFLLPPNYYYRKHSAICV